MVSIDMSGKITLVTGAGGGIGAGIAEVFAEAGSKVYIADLNVAAAEACSSALNEKGYLTEFIRVDVTSMESIKSMVDRVILEEGRIDNLVTCTGIMYSKPFMETTSEELQKTLDINLISTNNTCQEVLKHMIPRGYGRILNVASASSRKGSALCTHYSTSKFAVVGLTQGLALTTAKLGIRVNAVCPGFVETQIFRKLYQGVAESKGCTYEEAVATALAEIPMGRPQTPRDIGNACLFLCSDLSENITGQALNVDGALRMN